VKVPDMLETPYQSGKSEPKINAATAFIPESRSHRSCGVRVPTQTTQSTLTNPPDARPVPVLPGRDQQTFRKTERKIVPLNERPAALSLNIVAMALRQFVKAVLHRGGAAGILGLGKAFSAVGIELTSSITLDGLGRGLARFGLRLDPDELHLLMNTIEEHGRAFTFGDFLLILRGHVNRRRTALIGVAFKHLDSNSKGVVEVGVLAREYDPTYDPDVRAGRLGEDEALNVLMSSLGSASGTVSQKDFTEYYSYLSAAVDDDAVFERVIRGLWHVPKDKGWIETKQNTKARVTLATGEQTIVTLEDGYEFDPARRPAVMKQFVKQGVHNVFDYEWVDAR